MVSPSIDIFLKDSIGYDRYPVKDEFLFDTETPISLSEKLLDSDYLVLFESAEKDEKWARYSYVANSPRRIISAKGQEVSVSVNGNTTSYETGDPIAFFRSLIAAVKYPADTVAQGFCTGFAGYFAYDAVRYAERLPEHNPDDICLPDICLMEFDEVFVFDHFRHTLTIVVNTSAEAPDKESEYNRAVSRIDEIKTRLTKAKTASVKRKYSKLPEFTENISKESFMSMVERAREYIRAGDIFQVVLSRRLRSELDADPFDIYRMLRLTNPSPYMFYIKIKNSCLIGSSPETILKITKGIAETCPIAGTRRRGADQSEDILLEKELLSDGKEVSEHMMLVDLGRNDIGRISEVGSVEVDGLMHVEKFSHVMHLVTNVKGKLVNKMSALDALMAVMPAGTLSGAPKIRAMEIIEELEENRRGPYGGAAGYISFNGDADFCIIIRTIIVKGNLLYVQSGAGIVAESDPEREYEETGSKASALLNAILKAGEKDDIAYR